MARSETHGPRGPLRGRWALAAVLCVALLGAFVVYTSNRGMEFSLFGIGVVIAPEDDFIEVTKMLRGDDHDSGIAERMLQGAGFYRIDDRDPSGPTLAALRAKGFHHIDRLADAETLLNRRGFYHIGSQDLIDAVRRFEVAAFDPDPDVAEAKAARMRGELLEMMGTLAGPFALPGTLRGATADFIHALEELDAALGERREVSGLLTEMWERSLKHQPPFSQRWLRADVTVLPEGDRTAGRILACPQNDLLDDKYVNLKPLGDGPGRVELKVEHDEAAFPCDQRPATMVGDMLAGHPARLAVSTETARDLLAAGQEGPLLDGFEARFLLRPAHLASAGLLEARMSE